MTLTSTTVKNTHTGDGTTVAFSYGFKIFSETEIAVYVAGVLQTLTTHYTLSGVGTSTGGNVTFETGAKPASSASIVFVRVPARTQTTDYTITGTIDPQTVEDALDKATMLVQDIGDASDNAFGFANTVTDAGTIKVSLGASARSSKLLSFDASGNLVATQEIGTNKGNWAASTAYVARDIIKDTGTNNIFLCNTAHTSSGSLPITTNTDSAKWDLLVDAASATTSQTAAATSASAASTSATAAATSATASASSATSSASSSTSSASSATSSASSATSSASSSTTSGNYSNKVDGAVTGTEFSSKAWALGGTGVTDTASRGAAKEWATAAEDDLVDGSEYSAKHYSLKAQTHATNAAANSGPYYSATTGTNTYVATPTPALASYAEGVDIILKFGTGNTGSTTLNVSGLGAKGLKKADGSEFSSGELTSSQIQHFAYNGTEFRLLGTVAATEDLIKINTLDIFQNTINDMADHSDNLLETVDGFTDNFQDGSTQNNTAFDLTGSSGVTHDNTNKLWGNTDGSTGVNDDKPYTTEGNYIQQAWSETQVGANAVFTNGSATITTSGTFPTNCANGRISQDGTNWYDITTRDSATQLTLATTFGQSTVTGTFNIRLTKFDSGVVKLNGTADNNTNLLIHCDGTDASTTFTDSSSSAHTVTAMGDAQVDTAQSKFGGASCYLDAGGSPNDHLKVTASTEFDVGTSDYTWDFWYRTPSGVPGSQNIFSVGAATTDKIELRWESFGQNFTLAYEHPTQTNFSLTWDRGSSLSNNTWYHFALVRTGTSYYFFIDGTLITGAAKTGGDSDLGSFATPEIKFGVRAVIQYPLLGWVDEIRFSKGIARWTSGFTPSTSAYSLTINNIGEYVSVADSYSQSSDVSAWSDINSSTVTETLNAQNAYYWYSFDPASSYGVGTEIVVPKPVVHTYGSDVTSGQTFTASASNSAGENQDKAFDDNASTYWNPTNSSAVPQWIKVQFGSAQTISKITLNSGNTATYSYTVDGSNDDSSWTTLLTITSKSYNTNTVVEEVLTATGSYTYYRLNFTASSTTLYIREIEMIPITSSTTAYIRPIAKNDAGTWKYNSNTSANNTFTAATSTVNEMLHSVSQAISSEAQNRLTGTEIGSLVDADFNLTNGFTTSDSKLTRGLTLISSSTTGNPEVSLFRVNYDSDKADGTFLTRAFGGTNMPPAPSGNIDTMVALIIDKRTTGTPVYEASSNGGTTWTAFSTWIHEEVMSNGYTKRMAEIDVSAHTGARTSPLIRITNGSIGEDYDLKAIGIKYK